MPKMQVTLGIIFIIGGLILELIPFIGWIYGSAGILIGIFLIIFRNAESEIEKIKEEKK